MKKKKVPMSRSENMRRIKSKDTKIERILGKAMWAAGLRYRKQCKEVYGKPDFCFIKQKIAIFCDSEFWHGKKYLKGEVFKSNADFWKAKIKTNIKRDKEVNEHLLNEDWIVLRFWGKEIQEDIEMCLNKIRSNIEK